MFWIINKDKVYSYIVTLCVIGILFAMPMILQKEKNNFIIDNNVEKSVMLEIKT